MSTPGPNWFVDRSPWLVILFAGVPALAALTKINGLETSDEWKKQKSKETSGQTKVFSGTTVADFKLTYLATTAAEYAWILAHWEQLKPVPGLGGGTSAAAAPAAGPPAFQLGSPAAKGSAPATTTATTPDAASSTSSTTATPSPGPRPPTLAVSYPWLAMHGIFAVARAKWEGPVETDTGGVEVTITYSVQDPPKPAGVGTMAPAAPGSQFQAGGGGGAGSAAPAGGAGATQGNAAAGAAGT